MSKCREKITPWTFSVCGGHGNHRVHDFIKGWGTVSKAGKTILWDDWQRPKRRKFRPHVDPIEFAKMMFPVISRVMPASEALADIFKVQPMNYETNISQTS